MSDASAWYSRCDLAPVCDTFWRNKYQWSNLTSRCSLRNRWSEGCPSGIPATICCIDSNKTFCLCRKIHPEENWNWRVVHGSNQWSIKFTLLHFAMSVYRVAQGTKQPTWFDWASKSSIPSPSSGDNRKSIQPASCFCKSRKMFLFFDQGIKWMESSRQSEHCERASFWFPFTWKGVRRNEKNVWQLLAFKPERDVLFSMQWGILCRGDVRPSGWRFFYILKRRDARNGKWWCIPQIPGCNMLSGQKKWHKTHS